jgi:hypothetical protein
VRSRSEQQDASFSIKYFIPESSDDIYIYTTYQLFDMRRQLQKQMLVRILVIFIVGIAKYATLAVWKDQGRKRALSNIKESDKVKVRRDNSNTIRGGEKVKPG